MRTVAVDVLLALSVAITLWSVLGFVRARDAFQRLHFMTPVSTLAALAMAIAVAISGHGAELAAKALIVCVFTAVTSPVTQQKIARAMWVRRRSGWTLPEEEHPR